MTVATVETTIATILASVAGMGNVHDHVRTDTDRAVAEGYFFSSGKVNCWEYEVDSETLPDGATRLRRTEPIIRIVAHYFHDDANDSRGTFRDLLNAVGKALWDGFPKVKPEGVRLTEVPTLVMTRTNHSAYRAVLEFRLWDDE